MSARALRDSLLERAKDVLDILQAALDCVLDLRLNELRLALVNGALQAWEYRVSAAKLLRRREPDPSSSSVPRGVSEVQASQAWLALTVSTTSEEGGKPSWSATCTREFLHMMLRHRPEAR